MGAQRLPEAVVVAGPDQVSLRVWRVEDAAHLHEAVTASVEHLRPFLPWVTQEPMSLAARTEMVATNRAQWAQGGDAFYGLWVGDRAVGAVGAHHRGAPDGVEIGYWLRPDVVGQGLMTRAVRALTATLLDTPGITHVEIRMDEANAASAAVPPRCGYRLVGRERRPVEAPAETGSGFLWRIGADPAPQDPAAQDPAASDPSPH